jgi:hypothetical protein
MLLLPIYAYWKRQEVAETIDFWCLTFQLFPAILCVPLPFPPALATDGIPQSRLS